MVGVLGKGIFDSRSDGNAHYNCQLLAEMLAEFSARGCETPHRPTCGRTAKLVCIPEPGQGVVAAEQAVRRGGFSRAELIDGLLVDRFRHVGGRDRFKAPGRSKIGPSTRARVRRDRIDRRHGRRRLGSFRRECRRNIQSPDKKRLAREGCGHPTHSRTFPSTRKVRLQCLEIVIYRVKPLVDPPKSPDGLTLGPIHEGNTGASGKRVGLHLIVPTRPASKVDGMRVEGRPSCEA